MVHVKQIKCIHHDMKNEKCQKMKSGESSARKDSPSETEVISFPLLPCSSFRAGLDLGWLLQLDLLLGQPLDLLAEEGLAPGVGPAAGVGLPAAEVGLPREAGPLAGLPSS